MSLEKKNDLHWNMPGISQGGGDPRMSLGCEWRRRRKPASSIHLLSFISFFGIDFDFDTDSFFLFFQSHLFRWFVHKNQTSSSSSSRRRRRKKERKKKRKKRKEKKRKEKKKKKKKTMKLSRPAANPGHGSLPEGGPHLKGRDLGQRGSLAPGVQLNCRRRKKGYEFN